MTDEAATDDAVINEVAELIHQAGEAHAYHVPTGSIGSGPVVLGLAQAHLGDRLGPDLTRSELCYLLVRADREFGAEDGWSQKYAKMLIERH